MFNMLKGRGWFGGGLWRPKNPHSLEHLRYLYTLLSKNQIVSESNRGLLIETLRSIAEILIWGDQNDSSVFDFFLERNMLSFFLKIMRQKCGSYVCVQLLQTLNILFENIRNETSLYYLLSNNHVNSIIVHKFDFSDEEIMAYYISFLKTLSLKLNSHTVHFFFNETTHDFPLYTEAIKFFNHPESMVRIAVRTLTLNVYRVSDHAMLTFIRDRTAAPYFSNLVWFIGNHILELDTCVRSDVDHSSRNRLSDLVAEHLDHLHYLNDILKLEITSLNAVLADHLLNRLLVPLLVYSLNPSIKSDRPCVSSVLSLFLLAQVFLIISYLPLLKALAKIILNADNSIFSDDAADVEVCIRRGFIAPEESLEKSLQVQLSSHGDEPLDESPMAGASALDQEIETDMKHVPSSRCRLASVTDCQDDNNIAISDIEATHLNITDEEKEQILSGDFNAVCSEFSLKDLRLSSRPFLQSILNALDCNENDYTTLFALCLLYSLGHNPDVNRELLHCSLGTIEAPDGQIFYNSFLVDRMVDIVALSCQHNSAVRVITLEITLLVLMQLIAPSGIQEQVVKGGLRDQQLAALEGAKEEATLILRNFYKSEEIFLDMFEDEWQEVRRKPVKVEFLLQDPSILLPPAGTPLTGIDFNKRLPCGEVERARHAMRVFFFVRSSCLNVREETDVQLPLTNPAACIQVEDVLDLNNSDLIACVVITRDGQRTRRFLVIDVIQLILVEPDTRKLGWGVAKFVGFLQDLEVTGDKDDSRVLHLTIHRPSASSSAAAGLPSTPLLAAKFVFDDHIRCMAAKQRLTKGRQKARQKKLHQIARLLELPGHLQPCPSPPLHALHTMRQEAHRRVLNRSGGENRVRSQSHRPMFNVNKVPGFALKREGDNDRDSRSISRHDNHSSALRSSSQCRATSGEEIPLENITHVAVPVTAVRAKTTVEHNQSLDSQSSFPIARLPATATPSNSCDSPAHVSEGNSNTETSFSGKIPLTRTSVTNVSQGGSSSIGAPSSFSPLRKGRIKGNIETV